MINLIRSWFKTAVPNGNEVPQVLDNPVGPAFVMAKNSPDFELASQLFFHENDSAILLSSLDTKTAI